MRISFRHLQRYCSALPADPAGVRALLEDVGIEVKRAERTDDDVLWSLEFLANRGDHRCYAGIARELCTRLGAELRLPEAATPDVGDNDNLRVRVESELCGLYTATLIDLGAPGAGLPKELLVPLIAAGSASVNAATDATNVANLELGQPTHAFDADTIAGDIVVRLSRPGEQAWPLFQPGPSALPEGTLVVADARKVLAIAGVIGCEESKVTERTARLALESAFFDPVAVRLASRALRVQTDASARFERGSDPSLVLHAAGRVVHLLETHAGARRRGRSVRAGAWADPERTIELDPARLERYFLQAFDPAWVRERLGRLGFTPRADPGADRLTVRVPPHRLWDIHDPEDLYEELARAAGYNELPTHLPAVANGVLPSEAEQGQERVEEVLLGLGFQEVVTNAFYDRRVPERLALPPGHALWEHVETVNAIDAAYSLLKNNCLAQALGTVADNLGFGTEPIKAFEWTRTFHPDPTAPNGLCRERRVLWLVVCGQVADPSWAQPSRAADVWYLKGVVEELAAELHLPLQIDDAVQAQPLAACLHPYRRAAVSLAGAPVGLFGEVGAPALRGFRIKRRRVYYLELEADGLRPAARPAGFVPPPVRPPSMRMLAFTLPPRVSAGEVVACLRAAGPAWLADASVVDSYEHEDGGQPVRTLTFALAYRNERSEHTVEELNAVTEDLVRAVEQRLGPRGVRLRVQAAP